MSILPSKLEICPEEKETFSNCCEVAPVLGVAITDPELFNLLRNSWSRRRYEHELRLLVLWLSFTREATKICL